MTYLAELRSVSARKTSNLALLKLLVFDVDGVLTDGSLHFTDNGETTKVFHVRDGVGIKLLSDMGIDVVIMTAKDSPMVKSRVEQLGVKHYFSGVKDKAGQLSSLLTALNLTEDHVGYVGDDMVDIKPMSLSGVSFCPQDAYGIVRDCADIILPVNGGQGVARYVCDLVLLAKGVLEDAYELTTTPEFERLRQRTTEK